MRAHGEPFPMGGAAELTIYRIVQECLTNTIKHAAASCVQVTLRFRDALVELRVADDGAPALAALTAGGASSAGHGLNGMRERAALHGGVVHAGPAPEGGWIVSTALQLDWCGDRALNLRVILVDDQPLLRQGTRMILEAEGDIEVVGEAGNGHEAVALAEIQSPDVVLMDIRMPVVDGIEATRRIVAPMTRSGCWP